MAKRKQSIYLSRTEMRRDDRYPDSHDDDDDDDVKVRLERGICWRKG